MLHSKAVLLKAAVVGVAFSCVVFVFLTFVQRTSQRDKVAKQLATAGPNDSSTAPVSDILALPPETRNNLAKFQDAGLRAALLDLELLRTDINTSEQRPTLAIQIAQSAQPATDANQMPDLRAHAIFAPTAYAWARHGPFVEKGEQLEELALRYSTSAFFMERNMAARLVWAALVVPRKDRTPLMQARLERTIVNLALNPEVRADLDQIAPYFRDGRIETGKSQVLFDNVDAFLVAVTPK